LRTKERWRRKRETETIKEQKKKKREMRLATFIVFSFLIFILKSSEGLPNEQIGVRNGVT
jgi:hypothetical protein